MINERTASRMVIRKAGWLALACLGLSMAAEIWAESGELRLNELDYFETRGVNVLAFSNWYNGMFDDSKISGIEIIHHGVRTVTNGDVRLHATPEQWDAIPQFVEREVDKDGNRIVAHLRLSLIHI